MFLFPGCNFRNFHDITKITNNATTTTIVCFDNSYIFYMTTIYLIIILRKMSCFFDTLQEIVK
jgi:hypothetical protein